MHCLEDRVGGMRSGDGEHLRMPLANALGVRSQAAGDDDAPILLKRLANGLQRFINRRVDETAGVDHDQVGASVARGNIITPKFQFGNQPFAVHQCLGTA